MRSKREPEIQTVLHRVDVGDKIVVNDAGPWEVVSTGTLDARDRPTSFDTYWIANELDGDRQYRLWAATDGDDSPPRCERYDPDSDAGTGPKRRAAAVSRLLVVTGDDAIVSDTLATDRVEGV